MKWVYDDGGRAEAGFKRQAGDCVARAIAIATEKHYMTVYHAVNLLALDERITRRNRIRSSARTVRKKTYRAYLHSLGWIWHPTMGIGTGCRVHLRDGELPMGRLIVDVSRHLVAVIDGVVHDLNDPTRGETRCVYGYWTEPERI